MRQQAKRMPSNAMLAFSGVAQGQSASNQAPRIQQGQTLDDYLGAACFGAAEL